MAANFTHKIEKAGSPDNTQIVTLSGEIDESNQGMLEEIFEKLLSDDSVKNIVFNISSLDYVNSGVIGMFAVWHEKFVKDDKLFVFAEANEHIFDILDLVGLTSVVDHFTSTEEACLSFEN